MSGRRIITRRSAELSGAIQRMALLQALPDLPAGEDEEEDAVLSELAQQFAPEDLQLLYQIAITSRRDLDYAPDARAGFEMALLRMLAFRPQAVATGTALEATPAATRSNVARAAMPAASKSAPVPAVARRPPRRALSQVHVGASPTVGNHAAVQITAACTPQQPCKPQQPRKPRRRAQRRTPARQPTAGVEQDWAAIVAALGVAGTGAAARGALPARRAQAGYRAPAARCRWRIVSPAAARAEARGRAVELLRRTDAARISAGHDVSDDTVVVSERS